MQQLVNERQLNILEFIRKNETASNKEITRHLKSISRFTVIRDIDKLLKIGLIEKRGGGRSVFYQELVKSKLLIFFDIEEYFKDPVDKRKIIETFNFEIFKDLKEIFNKEELKELNNLNEDYRKRIKELSPAILKKEFERLTIDLSWKSSHIEGNTYSLIDTEILIKENKEARGHKKEEAIMILNHKEALDYILDKRNDFKQLTLRKVENIHKIIVDNLGISYGIRKKLVGIVGTRYKPLDNEYQTKEALEKSIRVVNRLKDPFSKALILLAMISYIQPFEDGNKRTSRLLADAMLLAYNVCPLSFRNIDEADYKKAMILFYEKNSIRFLKELFIQQFNFAIENYFIG